MASERARRYSMHHAVAGDLVLPGAGASTSYLSSFQDKNGGNLFRFGAAGAGDGAYNIYVYVHIDR